MSPPWVKHQSKKASMSFAVFGSFCCFCTMMNEPRIWPASRAGLVRQNHAETGAFFQSALAAAA